MSAVMFATNGLGNGMWREFGQRVRLDFGSFLRNMTGDQFEELCLLNRDWRFERTKEGDILIMAPVHTETGGSNFALTGQLFVWVKSDKTGQGFDSSTGFTLSNGAIRSPDLAWVSNEKLASLAPEKRKKFYQLAPDFVVELLSSSDSLTELQNKMVEYLENGVQLGWLIDRKRKRVYVYRPDRKMETLNHPAKVSGEPFLKGFVLDMAEIWG